MAGQCIVWRHRGRGAGGLANTNGDGLTVSQGHDDRRTGDWRANCSGISDSATFSRGLGGSQFDGGGVDGVSDVGHRWRSARNEVLEVAARCILDRHFDFAGVFVDVIGRRWNSDGASGFAGVDGNHRAIRQGHGDWRASGIGQRRGVDDRTTFSHSAGRSQRQVSGVDSVGDIGRNRGLVRHQIFEVTAAHLGDRIGDRRVTAQCIVRRSGGGGAGGLTNTNGDGLTVSQGHDHRRTGHWRADGCGVSHAAALSRRLGRGEFDGGSVDGVGDVGHGRHGARH